MVTQAMSLNFAKYGDLVVFNAIPGLVSGSDKVLGVFSIFDSNSRPLLAGLSVFQEFTAHNVELVLKSVLTMHKKLPLSILTNDEPEITEAIHHLQKTEIFKAVTHLLNPTDVISKASTLFKGSFGENVKTSSTLTLAANARNRGDYEKAVATLMEITPNRKIVEQLLKTKSTAFYCESSQAFVALGKNYCKLACDFLLKQSPSPLPLVNILKTIISSDNDLTSEAIKQFQPFNNDLGMDFKDQRLEEVLKSFEKEVAERFVESYIKGVRNCETVVKDKKNLIVKEDGREFRVTDWQCECFEMAKTGVACPHVIAGALIKEDRPYTSLVSWKWRKDNTN